MKAIAGSLDFLLVTASADLDWIALLGTLRGKGRLHYAFTIDDPTIWEKPWGGEYEFSPMQGVIYEYACHEGNYALAGILAGAREEEKEGREQAGNRGAVREEGE